MGVEISVSQSDIRSKIGNVLMKYTKLKGEKLKACLSEICLEIESTFKGGGEYVEKETVRRQEEVDSLNKGDANGNVKENT